MVGNPCSGSIDLPYLLRLDYIPDMEFGSGKSSGGFEAGKLTNVRKEGYICVTKRHYYEENTYNPLFGIMQHSADVRPAWEDR